jgi:hypothetical protein
MGWMREQVMRTGGKAMDWTHPERGELRKGYTLVVVATSPYGYSDVAVHPGTAT